MEPTAQQRQATRRHFLQATAAGAAWAAWPAAAPAAASAASAVPAPAQPAWWGLDATDLAAALRAGEITPLQALDSTLERVAALPRLNAVVLPDYERARRSAQQLSTLGRAARAQATQQAPLWGVPFTVKDLHADVQGMALRNGSRMYADHVSTRDSTLVQRYKAAGLQIFAKTASPELGLTATTESALHGRTCNPWNPALSAGGSSGGAAAVVAAGISPIAQASDGGGSIRMPASFCGVFGLKPSRGRMPMGPQQLEGWMGLSTQHAITRTVRDSALLLDVGQGPEAGSRVTPPKDVPGSYVQALQLPPERGLRIAVWRSNYFQVPVHPEHLAALDAAVALCQALGHTVHEAMPQLPVAEIYGAMGVATSLGVASTVAAREQQLGRALRDDELEPMTRASAAAGAKPTAAQVYAARAQLDTAGQLLDVFMQDYDLILTPTTAVPTPELGQLGLDQPYDTYVQRMMAVTSFVSLFNLTGQPAMSVPLHWSAVGLPVGVQFVAGYGREGRLLRLAAQLEQAAPWAQRQPNLAALQA